MLDLTWVPRNSPVDVFLEIAPLLDIIPETDFSFNGGIRSKVLLPINHYQLCIFCIAEFLYFPKTVSTIYFYFFCLIK
jgi:hypothetical protein